MSDKKQQEIEQSGWLYEAKLWVKEQWPMPFLGVLVVVIISCCICSPYLSPERRATNNDHTCLGWYLIGLAFIGGVVLCIPRVITSNPKKYFITRVLVTGITGGVFALLLPIAVKSTTTGVGGLRHSILLATGGLLAILTLGETRRKNDIDKRKNKQEKKKNDKDYRRQVRAERRERYTKAVEQLGDEKAPVRMGGVYTLVGLVDEWLEDESIEKYEYRLKEGQVIINNLCAYIRSPFTLASRYDELSKDNPISEGIYKDNQQKFYSDKAELKAEADVRLGIIKEIHDRLQGSGKNAPGAWSGFEYDFSGSTFFYPIDLTKSYYTKPVNFRGSVYEGEADFRGSVYEGEADFRGSIYKKNVTFSTYLFDPSYYQGEANFSGSTYEGGADFSGSTYKKDVTFSMFSDTAMITRSTYKGKVDFSGSTYKGEACFAGSTYKGVAYFHDSIYQGEVYFRSSTYESGAYYEGVAYFHNSIYQGEVYFDNDTTYKGGAYFHDSIYQGKVYFRSSTYEGGADFSGSIFYSEIYFNYNKYSITYSRFVDYAPQFYDKKKRKNTLFGSHNNDFTVDNDKGYPIDLNPEGIPLKCKFLTSEQKAYLGGKFQEIEKINNKLREVKDPKEKEELLKKLRSLNEKLHKWREKVTTVKVEDGAIENMES